MYLFSYIKDVNIFGYTFVYLFSWIFLYAVIDKLQLMYVVAKTVNMKRCGYCK